MSIDVNVQNDLVIVTESSEDITVNVSNAAGPAGANGVGVPVGGTTGQVLKKLSNTNYDTYWALDGGGVPYSGATGDVNLGEFQLTAGQLTLDVSPTGTAAVGTTRWNNTIGSSETTLKGGSVILKNGVDLVARVVNKVSPNTTLTKAAYQAVRVSGAQGQRLAVAYAQANNDANSADTIGLVTETIATNQEGFIITVGQLENINTTGSLQGETWADGDVLYLSPTTPGAITKVKPTGAGHIVVIGYVEYAHANNGKIYVKVMNGWELDELHDVSIVTPANNEVLIYESATALWKNKTIATALGYTPVPTTRTLTINGTAFDLSANRSWTISSDNIYTANGTLTGNRVVTMGANSLTFSGTNSSAILSSGTLTLNDTRLGANTTAISFEVGQATLSQIIVGNSTYPFAAGANSLNFYHNLAGPIAFYNGSGNPPSRRFSILTDGKVVVGDQTSASREFEVKSTLNGGGIAINSATANTSFLFNHTISGANIWGINSAGTGSSQRAGTLAIGSTNNNLLLFATGNVVLGASNSSDAGFRLDVNGTARVSGDIRTQNGTTYTDLTADATSGKILQALIPATYGLYVYINRTSVYGGGGVHLSSQNVGSGTLTGYADLNIRDLFSATVNSRNVNISTLGGTSSDNKFLTFGTEDATNSDLAVRFRVQGWGNCAIMGVTTRTGRNRNDFDFRIGYAAADLNTGTLAYRINGDSGNFIIGSVGTNVASAILNVDSNTKGFLPPRMTTTQKNAIASPTAGLMVFDTTLVKLCVHNGTTWETITSV